MLYRQLDFTATRRLPTWVSEYTREVGLEAPRSIKDGGANLSRG